jgi:hypothetical protein
VTAPAESARRGWRSPAFIVSWLSFAGYLLLAATRVDVFPVTQLRVYDLNTTTAGTADPAGGRILARDAHGGLREPEAWTGWRCDRLPDEDSLCLQEFECDRHRDEMNRKILQESAGASTGGQPVDAVRHVWHFVASGLPRTEDRLLAHCQAVPR